MEMSLVATRLDCAAMERDCSDSDGLKARATAQTAEIILYSLV